MHSPYLMVRDKWDHYAIDDEKGVEFAALKLLRTRVEQGFWYEHNGVVADRAKQIVAAEDADAALEFLIGRRDAEYEWVEVKA